MSLRGAKKPLVLAVPSKGRLQENAAAFFARAGLTLLKPRGARDYRGSIADLPAIGVAYLSAAEIVEALAEGGAHFGITGRDLVHELISDPDQRSIFIDRARATRFDYGGQPPVQLGAIGFQL